MSYTLQAKPISMQFPSPVFDRGCEFGGYWGGEAGTSCAKNPTPRRTGPAGYPVAKHTDSGWGGGKREGGSQTSLHDLYVAVQVTPHVHQNTFQEERKRDGVSCSSLTTENPDSTVVMSLKCDLNFSYARLGNIILNPHPQKSLTVQDTMAAFTLQANPIQIRLSRWLIR